MPPSATAHGVPCCTAVGPVPACRPFPAWLAGACPWPKWRAGVALYIPAHLQDLSHQRTIAVPGSAWLTCMAVSPLSNKLIVGSHARTITMWDLLVSIWGLVGSFVPPQTHWRAQLAAALPSAETVKV